MSLFEPHYFVTATSLTFVVGFYVLLLGLAFWCYTLSKRRRNSAKSFLSLTTTLSCWGVAGLGAMVAVTHPELRVLVGLAGLFILVGTAAGASLAIIGLIECARERKMKGRIPATITLIFTTLVFCFFCISVWSGMKRVRREQVLTFKEMQFRLRPPESPWSQADARSFGRISRVAFINRARGEYFLINADYLSGSIVTRDSLVEFTKESLRRTCTSYHLLHEREAVRHGIAGWQTEAEVSLQGRLLYHIHWIVTASGYGYDLVAFGPADDREGLKALSEDLFSRFELTDL